jgi:outer membrane protein OmpA-like peptidoglycan-associated protein
MRRRGAVIRRLGLSLVAATLATLLLVAPGARHVQAQERFDPQLFHPSLSQRSNAAGVSSADLLSSGAFELGLLAHYDARPLVVRSVDGSRLYSIIDRQASLHLLGSVGLFDRLELGLDIPVILMQRGDTIPTLPNFNLGASDAGAGPGDVRLGLKLRLFNTHTEDSPGGAAMALVLEGFFPTGDQDDYQGEGWRVSPRLVLDGVTTTGHRVSISAGYTHRSSLDAAGLSVGGTVDWGVAIQFRSRYVHVVPEVRGSIVVAADDFSYEEAPTEAALNLRFLPIEQLMIQAGAGVGLFQGFGAPDYRVLFGMSWMQVPDRDRDGDGIANRADACPEVPEDMDSFEDADGCPDVDNDADGIPDEPDQCPNEPEDADGFEDSDGCPDPDNDQDRILDAADRCPLEAEDYNGVEDTDGCPEVDSDGDGLLDPHDQCPQQPEDRDRYQDEDGCPDPDNDGDGILDAVDRCPMQPEVINGFEDEDGCPDETVIQVTCASIEIRDNIYFETNRAVIQRRSFDLLNQLAGVITSRPDIRRVSVEGHTDSRGRDRHNLQLSQQRAASVREYLMARGVPAERLVSQGFGETRPIDDNNTPGGRAANRRVEFVILEQDGCRDD